MTKASEQQVGGGHYKDLAIQPIEYIHKNKLSFPVGNVIKYVTRYKFKNGEEDLNKAIHFLNLIKELEYPGDEPATQSGIPKPTCGSCIFDTQSSTYPTCVSCKDHSNLILKEKPVLSKTFDEDESNNRGKMKTRMEIADILNDSEMSSYSFNGEVVEFNNIGVDPNKPLTGSDDEINSIRFWNILNGEDETVAVKKEKKPGLCIQINHKGAVYYRSQGEFIKFECSCGRPIIFVAGPNYNGTCINSFRRCVCGKEYRAVEYNG